MRPILVSYYFITYVLWSIVALSWIYAYMYIYTCTHTIYIAFDIFSGGCGYGVSVSLIVYTHTHTKIRETRDERDPDSSLKFMWPTWGSPGADMQDPGGPPVGHVNLAICGACWVFRQASRWTGHLWNASLFVTWWRQGIGTRFANYALI